MDFDYTEDERALLDLASQIVGDHVDNASLRALEAAETRVDRPVWQMLAEAGVLGALLPESDGGAGLGMVALGGVMETIGRHAARLPALSTLALGALPIAADGTADQRSSILPGVIGGTTLVAGAYGDRAGIVGCRGDDSGWTLQGERSYVIDGLDADWVVFDAVTDFDERIMFVLPTDTPGLTRTALPTTTGRDEAVLGFDEVEVGGASMLGGPGVDVEAAMTQIGLRADVAICSMMAGHCVAAMELMATYTKERQQFERVIASFQAVSQRAGDIYMDAEAIALTARSAAWRLDAGLDAEAQVAIARWWAAEGGDRITRGATHLHGGVGVDRDYPLHRHYLAARHLELTLGTAEEQLARIGTGLAQ